MELFRRTFAVAVLLSAAVTAGGPAAYPGDAGPGRIQEREGAGSGGGGPGSDAATEEDEEIAAAAARLGHDDFDVRERATEFLWRRGAKAEAALRKALGSSDPEVVARAGMILEKIELGLTPDAPKELAELVARYRDSGGEDRVLAAREMENFGAEALPILLAASAKEKDRTVRPEILASLERCALRAFRERIEAGETNRAEEILAKAASGGDERMLRHYAALLFISGRLEKKISELETAVGNGGEAAQGAAAMIVFLRVAAGDMEGAERAARLSGRKDLLDGILLERGKWTELAPRLLAASAGEEAPGGGRTGSGPDGGPAKNLQEIAIRATICRLARDGQGCEKAAAELAEAAAASVQAKGAAGTGNAEDTAKLLILAGKVREAIRLLEAAGRLDAVRDIHMARLSLREALDAAIRAEGRGQDISLKEDLFSLRLYTARLYIEIGEDGKADAAIAGLLKREKPEFSRGEDETFTERAFRLVRMIEAARERSHAKAIELCFDAMPLIEEEPERAMWLAAELFPGQEEEAAAWWCVLRSKPGGGAVRDSPAKVDGGAGDGAEAGKSSGLWKRLLRRVLSGTARKGRAGAKDAKEVREALETLRRLLAREAEAAEVAQRVEDAMKAIREGDGQEANHIEIERLLTGLAATCEGYGLYAKALELLDEAERRDPSVERHMLAGDFRAARGKWAEAAERYMAAWELERSSGFPEMLPLFLYGRAMAEAGKPDEGGKATAKARLLPLADAVARLEIRTGLAERLMDDEAQRELDIAVRTRPFAGLPPNSGAPVLNLCERETDAVLYPREAAAAAERRLLRLVTDGDERISCRWGECLAIRFEVHMARALRSVADGAIGEAMEEAEAAREVLPGEIRLPIALAEAMDKAGRKKEADEIVDRSYRFLGGICSKDSGTARHCNNLAWMLAKCRRRLDDALALAERAVSLDPCNQYYLDTLAEVHFQRGDSRKAAELAKKCMALNPLRGGGWRAQLARFEKSLRTQP